VKVAVLGFLVGATLLLAGIRFWVRSAKRPPGLGVQGGKLAPCPETPNCVSTRGADPAHRMDPLPYTSTREAAQERLLRVLASLPRARILVNEPGYVAAEFRTPGFGFPDDVEFLLDDDEKVVHFRSASRLGTSDLGWNRRRMTDISRRFTEAATADVP
jgi:uncharacterized protein (DUF1499 family)